MYNCPTAHHTAALPNRNHHDTGRSQCMPPKRPDKPSHQGPPHLGKFRPHTDRWPCTGSSRRTRCRPPAVCPRSCLPHRTRLPGRGFRSHTRSRRSPPVPGEPAQRLRRKPRPMLATLSPASIATRWLSASPSPPFLESPAISKAHLLPEPTSRHKTVSAILKILFD